MKKTGLWLVGAIGLVAIAIGVLGAGSGDTATRTRGPQYTADNRLLWPEGYREWVYLSSGLGMNYSPLSGGGRPPMFTNVFVLPSAYKRFMATGHWPDQSMFVVEIYTAASHGSINRQGHYEDAFMGLDVEVKDEGRFPDKWAYFGFGSDRQSSSASPKSACWSCHNQNGAVENTFTQFYPTLLEVAYAKNVIKPEVHLTPGVNRMVLIISQQGWQRAEPIFDQAKAQDPAAEVFAESSLNLMGYQLLRAGKTADAVGVFQRAVRDYSSSPNTYDSLAEGYLAAGDKSSALDSSQKALAVLAKDAALDNNQKAAIQRSAEQRIAKLKLQK
jgi:tetratricopeptide (TPR) repeat protein